VSIDTAAIEQEFYDKIMLAWNEKENWISFLNVKNIINDLKL
jgi:hypothetical protein